jgi:hypothetical protein
MATITLSKYTELVMEVLKPNGSLVTGRINSQFLSAIRGNVYSFVCRLLEKDLVRCKVPLPKIWLDENGRAREADFVKDDGTTETVVNETPDEPDYSEADVEDMPLGPKELEEMYKAKYNIGEEEDEGGGK